MDRRQFLRSMLGSTGSIVVASTMAEAGLWAEFMSWLQRKPAWSFPSIIKRPQLGVTTMPAFDEINALTLQHIKDNIVFDEFFKNAPLINYFRKKHKNPLRRYGL